MYTVHLSIYILGCGFWWSGLTAFFYIYIFQVQKMYAKTDNANLRKDLSSIELPAKLLNWFSRINKSNINHSIRCLACAQASLWARPRGCTRASPLITSSIVMLGGARWNKPCRATTWKIVFGECSVHYSIVALLCALAIIPSRRPYSSSLRELNSPCWKVRFFFLNLRVFIKE